VMLVVPVARSFRDQHESFRKILLPLLRAPPQIPTAPRDPVGRQMIE